jgi:hypothetical protein
MGVTITGTAGSAVNAQCTAPIDGPPGDFVTGGALQAMAQSIEDDIATLDTKLAAETTARLAAVVEIVAPLAPSTVSSSPLETLNGGSSGSGSWVASTVARVTATVTNEQAAVGDRITARLSCNIFIQHDSSIDTVSAKLVLIQSFGGANVETDMVGGEVCLVNLTGNSRLVIDGVATVATAGPWRVELRVFSKNPERVDLRGDGMLWARRAHLGA